MKNITLNIIGQRILADVLKEKEAIIKMNILFFENLNDCLKNTKNRTVLVFKKRRRKNSRKKYGHRQPISLIKITKIFS